jgi:hypothetical protein
LDARIQLIEALWDTVPEDALPPLSEEWLAEISQRSAEYDAGSGWSPNCVGLGQWLCQRARLEWVPDFAATIELVTRWPTSSKPRSPIGEIARQIG